MKVGFLIRTLEQTGGAEQQLTYLAQELKTQGVEIQVFCFYGIGELRSSLEQHGVPVHEAGKKGRWDLGFLRKLQRQISAYDPDLLHSYLESANLVTAAAALLNRRMRVVWGVRASDMDLAMYDYSRRVVTVAETALSRFVPDLIVANSLAGTEAAVGRGMPRKKVATVHNGIDANKFRPDKALGRPYRHSWGADDDTLVIGRVARFDPMKDHRLFLSCARELSTLVPNTVFVCVGNHTTEQGRLAIEHARALGIQDQVRWVMPSTDMVGVFNAMDLVVSTSAFGEGFPNVIAEAMACGVPTVATDVGDSALLLSDQSRIVPRRDKSAMVQAMRAILEKDIGDRKSIGEASRLTIVQRFSLEKMASTTLALYEELLR